MVGSPLANWLAIVVREFMSSISRLFDQGGETAPDVKEPYRALFGTDGNRPAAAHCD
jgi:hypothetical protein